MGKTTNLGLHTTATNETSKTFLEYRTELSGTGADSNMNIIDKAYGDMDDKIDAVNDTLDAKIDANKQDETTKFSTLNSTVSGIQSGLSQEVAARTSEDQLLNTRIDELVAPSGEAPSAAEVQDARVGVDSTTYASLGAAIRGQVGNLKSDIQNRNSYNMISAPPDKTDTVSSGITWKYNYTDQTIHVSGTASSTTLNNYIYVTNMDESQFKPGESYTVEYYDPTSKVEFRVLVTTESNTEWHNIYSTRNSGGRPFELPEDTTQLIIRLAVSGGTSNVDVVVAPRIWNSKSNKELQDEIETNYVSYRNRNYLENSTIHRTNLAYSDSLLYPGYSSTSAGITFTVNPDYSIHVSGVSTATALFHLYSSAGGTSVPYNKILPEWYKSGKLLKLSYKSEKVLFRLHISNMDNATTESESYNLFENLGPGMAITKQDDYENLHVDCRLVVSGEGVEVDETVYPILTEVDPGYVEDDLITGDIRLRVSPLLPYLNKAWYGSVSDDSANKKVIPGYTTRNSIRISLDVTGIESCNVRMLNSRYVFRLYWYTEEDDLLHTTAWGRSWIIPENHISCSITIKKPDDVDTTTVFRPDENPLPFLIAEPSKIKPWFKTEIEDVTRRVKSANSEPGLVFIVSTDQHYNSVQGTQVVHDTITDMVINQKELLKHINVDGVVSLGDVADFKVGTAAKFQEYGVRDLSYSNLDNVFYNWMDYAVDKLASVHPNFIYVPGNHDDNRYINKDNLQEAISTYDYTPQEMYSYYSSRSMTNRVSNIDNNGLDFYIDYPNYKIRLFCVDSSHYYTDGQTSPHGYTNCWWYGWQDSTVTWLRTQLSLVPSDYQVLLFSHMSVVKENNGDNVNYINQLNMYNVIQEFISNGGNFIGELYGHSHVDWSTNSPWLSITLDCQKCYPYNPNYPNMPGAIHNERVEGTATEDCWSIVIIQPNSKKIKIIRFGAGQDKEYAY